MNPSVPGATGIPAGCHHGTVPQTDRRPPTWGADASPAVLAVSAVAIGWLALKMVSIWAWVSLPGEYGDTYYYFLTAEATFRDGTGISAAFTEYPTPAGLLLLAPYALGFDDYMSYRSIVIVATSIADGAFAILLGRRAGPVGVLGWIALTTVLGQVALLRFDMLPAVAAGAAVLLAMQGAGRAASVLVALGTGLKLWPVVLAPLGVLAERGRRLRALVWFAATGAVLVAVSLLTGGWQRLLSPLGYQRDRGLQIEAVPATVPMAEWATQEGYRVWYSTFHAFEVTGPTVARWLGIAEAATLVAVAGCAVLLWVWWRGGCRREALGWVALTCVGAFIVTSRALSPQYLLWLAAPTAALLGLAWSRGGDAEADEHGSGARGRATVTFLAVLVLCVLTTAIYPVSYGGLIGVGDRTSAAIAVLTVRNLGLVALLAWTAVLAWRTSRADAARVGS